MLTLTENASTIVKDIADQIPEVSGLRITSEDGAQPAFEVAPPPPPSPATRPSSRTARPSSSTRTPRTSSTTRCSTPPSTRQGGVQFALMVQG